MPRPAPVIATTRPLIRWLRRGRRRHEPDTVACHRCDAGGRWQKAVPGDGRVVVFPLLVLPPRPGTGRSLGAPTVNCQQLARGGSVAYAGRRDRVVACRRSTARQSAGAHGVAVSTE